MKREARTEKPGVKSRRSEVWNLKALPTGVAAGNGATAVSVLEFPSVEPIYALRESEGESGYLNLRRNRSSKPKIPLRSRTPNKERLLSICHSNCTTRRCELPVSVM
jgi:hypothetical protein